MCSHLLSRISHPSCISLTHFISFNLISQSPSTSSSSSLPASSSAFSYFSSCIFLLSIRILFLISHTLLAPALYSHTFSSLLFSSLSSFLAVIMRTEEQEEEEELRCDSISDQSHMVQSSTSIASSNNSPLAARAR